MPQCKFWKFCPGVADFKSNRKGKRNEKKVLKYDNDHKCESPPPLVKNSISTQVEDLLSRGHGGEIRIGIDSLVPAGTNPLSPQEHPGIGNYDKTGYDHRAFDEYMKVVQKF